LSHALAKERSDADDRALPPLFDVAPRASFYCRVVKPIGDRVVSALILIIVSPYLAIVALLVRLKLGRKVVYRQYRVGQDSRVFTMYKFRTMAADRRRAEMPYPEPDRRTTHKSDNDPRHTPFGRTLRKWSLDELPQLWNVVTGDMSLVGPRPELKAVVMKYDLWDHPRHLVKPGITGPWQVSASREGLLHENLEHDVTYVAKVGLVTDIKILLGTPKAVLARRGR